MIIVQLAELGVLYRRVFNYMQSKQDPSIQDPLHEASMTEQVSRKADIASRRQFAHSHELTQYHRVSAISSKTN